MKKVSYTGNLASIYYTIFEGLSKGGNQLLLIFIAAFVSNALYVDLMLLISFEVLATMLFFSYYADVLYSFKKTRNYDIAKNAIAFSLIQYFLFLLVYLIFKKSINNYFEYDLEVVIYFILGNGFITNIFRFYSIIFQIDLNHKKALLFKSAPFFSSFAFCFLFFFLMDDKILAFFWGRFLGLFIFLIIIIFSVNNFCGIFSFSISHFKSFFKRAKFSGLIALLGWASGLGFLNFAKLYSANENYVFVLGLILTLFSIVQLFANGINQVYVPQLKSYLTQELSMGVKYSGKILLTYLYLSVFFFIACMIMYMNRNYFSELLPNMKTMFGGYSFLVVLLFSISAFSWVSTPYLIIFDKYKNYFWMILVQNIISWTLIAFLLFMFGYNNFLVFYFLIKGIEAFGIFIYVKSIIKSKR